MKTELFNSRLRQLYYRLLAMYYVVLGRRPKSRGYFEYKWLMIRKALDSHFVKAYFNKQKKLPRKFGVGIDERIIEYPWLMSLMPDKKAKLLDAGSTLNFIDILTQPKFENKRITIASLAPEYKNFNRLSVGYVYDDLRFLPFADGTFDIITCISTLEHLGMDNTGYINNSSYRENKPQDYILAVREFKRILNSFGVLFLTMPYGKDANFGSFQQFTSSMVEKVIYEFAPRQVREDYFLYSFSGWQRSNKKNCQNSLYGYKSVGAEAVVCLKLTKSR